ncbi:MAG: extracellular solute-binding protein [Oscillospiraceae bacterium]|nr:extracellular solute-binding protein [Oscillospiraceae bacterium]
MKPRRILALLLLSLSCLFLFSGCHGSRERSVFEIPDKFDDSREYEITFWAKNDTNKTQVKIYEEAVEDFQKLYPNIHVTIRFYTDYSKIYNDVITNISTNTTPNVCITYPDHIATYLTGEDVVVPLDELLTDRAYGLGGSQVRFDAPSKGEIVPQFLQELSIGGHIYGLPYMRSTEVLYVNKDLVEALGYTLPEEVSWDFVWEVSEKAMEKGADGNFLVNGQKVMIPFIDYSTDNMLIQLCKQKGSGYSTAAGEILLFNDDTKEFLYTIAEHAKTGAFSTFKISSYPGNFLNAGQCIFALDSTGGSTWIGTHAPLMDISPDKVVEFETAVRPIPQLNPDEPWMISQGPSVCIFNKADPQEVLASWLFVQYLMTDKVQIAYSQTEGYVPVTTKAQNAPEYLDYLSRAGEDYNEHYDVKIAASKLLLANIDHTFITPVFNGSSSLRSAAGQLIENVTKSMRRKETVDEAYMEKLYQDVVSLYRLDQISGTEVSGKAELGPLPKQAVTLLTCLAVAWVLIAAYALWAFVLRKKR